jgi:hypothetical protein
MLRVKLWLRTRMNTFEVPNPDLSGLRRFLFTRVYLSSVRSGPTPLGLDRLLVLSQGSRQSAATLGFGGATAFAVKELDQTFPLACWLVSPHSDKLHIAHTLQCASCRRFVS